MRNPIPFVVGAILGSLVGASVALLLAPYSGTELRDRMQGEADRIRSEVSKAASDRRAELEQQLAALRAPQKSSQL